MSRGLIINIVLLFCIQLIFVDCLAGMDILSCLISKHKQALYLSLTLQEKCMTVTCVWAIEPICSSCCYIHLFFEVRKLIVAYSEFKLLSLSLEALTKFKTIYAIPNNIHCPRSAEAVLILIDQWFKKKKRKKPTLKYDWFYCFYDFCNDKVCSEVCTAV